MRNLNLRAMESNSWRALQRDGLLDLFFGIVLLANALSMLFDELGTADATRIGMTSLVYVIGILGFWWARRRFVAPRSGVARFGATRQRRIRWTRIVLGIAVLVTFALFALVSIGRFSPADRLQFLGNYGPSALIGSVIMLPITALAIAFEHPRLLIHGLLFVAAEFATVTLASSASIPLPGVLAFGAASAVSLTIGITVFARFLRAVPRARIDDHKE